MEEENKEILLVAVTRDKIIRFKTGTDIKPIIPDIIAERIISHYILPDFKLGLYCMNIM